MDRIEHTGAFEAARRAAAAMRGAGPEGAELRSFTLPFAVAALAVAADPTARAVALKASGWVGVGGRVERAGVTTIVTVAWEPQSKAFLGRLGPPKVARVRVAAEEGTLRSLDVHGASVVASRRGFTVSAMVAKVLQ